MESEQWENYAQPVIVPQDDPTETRPPAGPNKRSGHRVFATDDFLYVVGGFNSMSASGSSTFRDIWILNLLTNKWKPMKLMGHFDDTMASFSLTFVPALRKFYVYGGTGFPFAENVSSNLYECTLVSDDCCKVEKLKIYGDCPPRLYGQSSVYELNYNENVSLYIVGGTQGYQYGMEIYEFYIHDKQARCKKLGSPGEIDGRYRHESFIYNNTIFSIGGSNDQIYVPFDTITGFDLREHKYFLKKTLPISDGRYPEMRKGHALVKYENKVYIFGGIHFPNPNSNPENILSDIWSLDLETFQWEQLSTQLPEAVFFHSGSITSKGQVLCYGGCTSSQPDPVRTHHVVTFFLNTPSLSWLCTRFVYEVNPGFYENNSIETYQFSRPLDLIHQALLGKKLDEDDVEQRQQSAVNNLAA